MSASQEKKRRQDVRAEGLDKRQLAEQKKQKEKRKRQTVTAVISAAIVLVAAAVILINSNFFYKTPAAVDIGGVSYSTREFNYFYFTSYYNFASSYGDMLQYLLDTSQPLESQAYSDDMSWADYFEQSALDTMRQVTMLYDKAIAEGYALSEEDIASIDESLATIGANAIAGGYTNLDHYLQASYGRGFDEATMRRMMEISNLAAAYSENKGESFTYTDGELEDFYLQNRDEYDVISYRAFYISGAETPADEEAGIEGIDAETAMSEAKKTAELIAAEATDGDSFAELVYDNAPEDSKSSYEDPDSTLASADGASLYDAYSEWLLDESRVSGDCEAIEDESGWYAVMFVSRDDNHYNLRSARHILIMAEAGESGEYTEESLAAAKEEIERLYGEWKDGAATEESFAELANQYSEDSGSNTNGGLYENIYKGMTVEEFDDFCFGDRKPGDTAIVYGESGSYAGYHIVYFVGADGQLYSSYIAETKMRTDDYSAWQEAELEGWPVTERFAFRFAR